MKKTTAAWLAGVLVIVASGSLVAHHSLAQFDTTTAVTVKGPIARIELINPHSIIFIDQKGADGQILHWAVEGPGITQLSRMSFGKEALKVGDIIEACGYILKEGVEVQRSVSGKLMDAEMLVLPAGQKLKWSDYGQHLCLGPDFHDFHQ